MNERTVPFELGIEDMTDTGLLCDAPILFNAIHARDERVFAPPDPETEGRRKTSTYSKLEGI